MANREKKLWQRTGFYHVLRAFKNAGRDIMTYRMFNAILKQEFGSCAPFRLIKKDLLKQGILTVEGAPKCIELTEKGTKLQGIIGILEQNLSVQTFCVYFDGYEFGNVKCKHHGKVYPFKCHRDCAQFVLKEVPR